MRVHAGPLSTCTPSLSDVCVGSPALRLGRLAASSPRDASTSLPLLSVLSSLGRKQRWWRCCSQGLRGRVGRSETTGGYVARLWGRGHMLPHFRSAQLTPTAPTADRGPRAINTDFPGPGFTTPCVCVPRASSLKRRCRLDKRTDPHPRGAGDSSRSDGSARQVGERGTPASC